MNAQTAATNLAVLGNIAPHRHHISIAQVSYKKIRHVIRDWNHYISLNRHHYHTLRPHIVGEAFYNGEIESEIRQMLQKQHCYSSSSKQIQIYR